MRDICHKFLLPAILTGISVGITACSDDDMYVDSTGGARIRFEVSAAGNWNRGISSRGQMAENSGKRRLPTVQLRSQDQKLYLIPEVTDMATPERLESRGTPVYDGDLKSCGVFATYTAGASASGLYMRNVQITEEGAWTPVDEYLWPGKGSLHFNAYAPYSDDNAPEAGNDGAITLPYETPTEVANQTDLMWATPMDASQSPCTLVFNHALTAVRFVTGDELTPCTVTSVKISGVKSSATLSVSDGTWSGLSGSASYEVSPGKAFEAAQGSDYTTPDEAITSDEETFMLLPQTLTEESSVTLTVEINGNKSEFEASLAGQTWSAGKMVTYRLSANPSASGLILDVTDAEGNPISSLSSKYTGSTLSYTVKSSYDDGTGATTPVEWEATLVDDDGNELTDLPVWLTDYRHAGSGDTDCELTTDLTDPLFLQMSDQTRALREAQDINTSSGNTPYNLSNSTGAASVENTANSYIINAPGHYSLPLVYGNAIKNSATNDVAYVSTLAQTTANKSKALFHFVNHLGNEITDPYIYNNSGCVPADATMVWEERIGLIRNVTLSSDRRSIEFEVPPAAIRQGNAMLAVRDAEGKVMWSWQIWVTDFKPGENWIEINNGTNDYRLYPRDLGRIYGGDETEFPESTAKMKITQKNTPEGTTPLSICIDITQEGKTITTNDCSSFYQWGRKDPFISGLQQFYDAAHNEINANALPTQAVGTSHKNMIVSSICNPLLFFTGREADARGLKPCYLNLWNIDQLVSKPSATDPTSVKTVYDPSPVGAKVPDEGVYDQLINYPCEYNAAENEMNFTLPDASVATFPVFGYRSSTGSEVHNDGEGTAWVNIAGSATLARYLVVEKSGVSHVRSNVILYGYGLRPAADN